MLATAELRRRRQHHAGASHITARRLAEFLQSVEAEETLLAQRLRDGESRTIPPETTGRSAEDLSGRPNETEMATTLSTLVPDETVGDQYGVF